jgi:alkanesulfonate monooxygenase SsuD/methylene tetrahydromethanopterin reductase-like flavin-dependent oxidoreductase (luciferase family)
MPDHGRPIAFGYFLVPNADAPLLATAVEAEARGLDYIAVQDHPYQRRYVDAFALLGMIAGRTSRIGLFPDVANLPLRPPAVLAKTAVSLDVLSGGRFELGLGAGGFWDAIEAYGGPRRTPAEALAALDEGIQVIRKVWSGERNLRFAGAHYRLVGAQSGPVPAHPIGIWLGVYGPKAIALAGGTADGWVPSLPADAGDTTRLREMTTRLDDAAAAAGRDPGDVRRVVNVNGAVTDGESAGLLRGPVTQWVDELTPLALDLGFDTFVFWGDGPGQLARFAEEVVPAVRAAITAARR